MVCGLTKEQVADFDLPMPFKVRSTCGNACCVAKLDVIVAAAKQQIVKKDEDDKEVRKKSSHRFVI